MSSSVFSPLWRYRKRLAVGWWLVPVQVLKGRFVLHSYSAILLSPIFAFPFFIIGGSTLIFHNNSTDSAV